MSLCLSQGKSVPQLYPGLHGNWESINNEKLKDFLLALLQGRNLPKLDSVNQCPRLLTPATLKGQGSVLSGTGSHEAITCPSTLPGQPTREHQTSPPQLSASCSWIFLELTAHIFRKVCLYLGLRQAWKTEHAPNVEFTLG